MADNFRSVLTTPPEPLDEEKTLAARVVCKYGQTPAERLMFLDMLGLTVEDLKRPIPTFESGARVFILAVRRNDGKLDRKQGRRQEQTQAYRPR